jgi:predicted dehydrogenase
MIGIGVIGAGYWGPNLIRNFITCHSCELRLVIDLQEDRLERLKVNYPHLETSTDYKRLLDDDRIHGIALATPVHTHYPLAKEVLQAGKSVFVEKPLAYTVDECRELVDLAQAKGQALMVGHTFEYNEAVRWVDRYIQGGELGDIHYIYSQRLNLGVVRSDVNALWNLAPHDISIVLSWLKRMPAAVNAQGYTYLQEDIEDVVFLNLEFSDGTAVHVHVSWLDPQKVRRTVLVGSKKMLVYDDVSTDSKIQIFDKGIDRKHIDNSLGDFDSFGKFQLTQRAGNLVIPQINFVEPLREECAHFVDCIAEKKTPLTDGVNGQRVVAILEAAQHSLKNNGVNVNVGL